MIIDNPLILNSDETKELKETIDKLKKENETYKEKVKKWKILGFNVYNELKLMEEEKDILEKQNAYLTKMYTHVSESYDYIKEFLDYKNNIIKQSHERVCNIFDSYSKVAFGYFKLLNKYLMLTKTYNEDTFLNLEVEIDNEKDVKILETNDDICNRIEKISDILLSQTNNIKCTESDLNKMSFEERTLYEKLNSLEKKFKEKHSLVNDEEFIDRYIEFYNENKPEIRTIIKNMSIG